MDVTFFIGNGFDINLGLATKYSDFVKEYKNKKSETETIERFKEYIVENEDLWSNAEIALGKYTSEFEEGKADKFAECQIDFCKKLSEYLKSQTEQLNFKVAEENIKNSVGKFNRLIKDFPNEERRVLQGIYNKRVNQNVSFNFLNFNYTYTLDRYLDAVKAFTDTIGYHVYNGKKIKHMIGSIIHVHGTVDKEMVFGVNDETQISKNEIFDCNDGDLYKNILIKRNANKSYLQNTDGNAEILLNKSDLIYIYGMSIGETDKLWWERICKWLRGSDERHLIIHKYDAPEKDVIPLEYQLFERRSRIDITQYCKYAPDIKSSIEQRIHIIKENIFEDISNLAKDSFERSDNDELNIMRSVS